MNNSKQAKWLISYIMASKNIARLKIEVRFGLTGRQLKQLLMMLRNMNMSAVNAALLSVKMRNDAPGAVLTLRKLKMQMGLIIDKKELSNIFG
jgi:hypothetical protein